MARESLDLPPEGSFSTDIPVRITDINYGRHVGNDALVGILHEARVRWLQSLGYPSEMLAEPVGLIMTELALRFRSESSHGDTLRVSLAARNFSRVGFEILYGVKRVEDGAEIARARTSLVFFDYAARRLTGPPVEFKSRLGV